MSQLSDTAIRSASSRSFARRSGLECWLASHGVTDPKAASFQCANNAASSSAFDILNCVGSTCAEQERAGCPATASGWQPERAVAAVVAALVADAASQTSHWRYDTDAFWISLGAHWDEPEFVWPPLNTTYSLPRGEFSCYGHQMMVVLQSIVASHGVDVDDLLYRMVAAFDEDTIYGPLYEPLDRPAEPRPWPGAWRHNSLHEFIKRVREGVGFPACGASDPRKCGGDSQVDCILRIIPVVALYAGTEQMMDKVHQVVKLTQNNSKAIAYAEAAARLLEFCILGTTPAVAVDLLLDALTHKHELADLSSQLKQAKRKERRELRERMFELEKSSSIEVGWKVSEVMSHHKTAERTMPFHTLALQAGSNWQSNGIA